jgi:hypothetical protein
MRIQTWRWAPPVRRRSGVHRSHAPTTGDPSRQAREAALTAVAGNVAEHLRHENTDPKFRDDPARPLILHVHGPGKSTFLETLSSQLDKGARSDDRASWTTIRFDAWQHQRVAPPWWWLINAIDRELRVRFRLHSKRRWLRKRLADLVCFRAARFVHDAFWILPGLAGLYLATHLWGMSAILKVLGGVVGAAGGVTALLALIATLGNAVRRQLLAQSPRGAAAVLNASDPMADLLQRYGFLVNTAGTPLLVLIENLDRCRADYVVQILEGIQTLLRIPPGHHGRKPLVAFAVAADQAWLCDSYLQVYGDFAKSAHAPGRPFGQGFLDKIFDVSLRVPSVPATATVSAKVGERQPFAQCHTEHGVRERLAQLEGRRAPVYDLRVQAIRRLGELEVDTGRPLRQCGDTGKVLQRLRLEADLGGVIDKRLDTSYCVHRTSLLLGGHAVGADKGAIARLGMWTMLGLRWPLLAAHLTRAPEHLLALRAGAVPEGVGDELAPVFDDPAATRLARGIDGVQLDPQDIRDFTTPLVSAAARRA